MLLASGVLFRGDHGVAGPDAVLHAGGTGAGSRQFDVAAAVIALIAVVVAIGIGRWLAGRFLRPLRSMTAAAREISATNLQRRLDLRGPNDELTQLGKTLDDLFARFDASFQAQRHFVATPP